jgi:hypothetical protein
LLQATRATRPRLARAGPGLAEDRATSNDAYLPCAAARPFMCSCSPTWHQHAKLYGGQLRCHTGHPFQTCHRAKRRLEKLVKVCSVRGRGPGSAPPLGQLRGIRYAFGVDTEPAFDCPDSLRADVTHAHALNACMQMLMGTTMSGSMHAWCCAHATARTHFFSIHLRITHTSAEYAHQMEDGEGSQVPPNAPTLAPAQPFPLVESPGKPAPTHRHAYFMEMAHANRLLHAHVFVLLSLTCLCAAVIFHCRRKCDSSLSRIGLLFALC